MLACSVCPWTRTSEQARSSSRCYGSSVVVAVKKSRRSSVVSFRLRHPDNDTYAGAQEKRPALRDLSNKAGGNFLQPNAGAKVCSFRPSVPGPWSPTHRSSGSAATQEPRAYRRLEEYTSELDPERGARPTFSEPVGRERKRHRCTRSQGPDGQHRVRQRRLQQSAQG